MCKTAKTSAAARQYRSLIIGYGKCTAMHYADVNTLVSIHNGSNT